MSGNSIAIERVAAAWLARRDRGDWSASDAAALETWLAEDIAHRVAFLRLEATWREIPRLKAWAAGVRGSVPPARGVWQHSPYFPGLAGDPESAVGEQAPAARPRARARRPWRAWATLAAGLCAVLVGLATAVFHDGGRVDRGEWNTGIATRQVQLADGSNATLGAGSELRAVLSKRQRDLYLPRGEVFFDVARDPARPFVVHAGDYRVTAVGTRFDVLRSPGGLRIVVTHGRVRLQPAGTSVESATMLTAGAIAVVSGARTVVQQVPLDEARDRLSWRDGYATFHQAPLAQAVEEFNRYNVNQIVIADPDLDGLRVGGRFRLDNGDAFVRVLQQIFPIAVARRDSRTVLSRRGARARH